VAYGRNHEILVVIWIT